MVLPTSFATSMLAWGMLTFGDVSASVLSNWICLRAAVVPLLRSCLFASAFPISAVSVCAKSLSPSATTGLH